MLDAEPLGAYIPSMDVPQGSSVWLDLSDLCSARLLRRVSVKDIACLRKHFRNRAIPDTVEIW